MKNWLKIQDYHLIIDNWNTENSLDIAKSGCKRTNSDKSMDFTIYKDEICKYITEIQGFLKIYWGFMQYLEIQIKELNSELNVQCKCK